MARYAAEVRDMDGQVTRLLDGLAERGVLDRAVVAITSDHGEALAGDHGYFFAHNTGLTQDQIHVPLVIRCPGCPSGTTESRPVSTTDVLPTALARLGLPLPEGLTIDGLDLFGPAGDSAAPRIVFSQRARRITVRRGGWKLHWQHGEGPTLYDLAADPGETRDVSADHAERTRELLELMREYLRRDVLAQPESRNMRSQKERDELRALGYL
jgi:arylsulfatase A-like enzyme